MVTRPSRFEKKLQTLERMRRDVEKKLDRSYLQNNISELLALEERYEAIVYKINKLKYMIAVNRRTGIII
jgi:hypothetical protein